MNPPAQPSTPSAAAAPAHAVPIRVVGRAGTTPPPQVATFFQVAPDGAIEHEIQTVPIVNGQAVYTGGPLPPGTRWAITVHEPGGLPIFRSGPLAELPGPASDVIAHSRVSIFRSDTPGTVGLAAPDGLPEAALQSLQNLPSSLRRVRVDQVVYSGDAAGHEIVKVIGRVRASFFFFWRRFTYARVVTLRPNPHPGHPASIAVFDSGGPDIATGASLGLRALDLSAAIGEAILKQLDAALKHIATLQSLANGIDFPADLVSVTSLHVTTDARLRFLVHGGTITQPNVVVSK